MVVINLNVFHKLINSSPGIFSWKLSIAIGSCIKYILLITFGNLIQANLAL